LKKPITEKGWWSGSRYQGVGPEFPILPKEKTKQNKEE
jgi:hypothetical protein